MLTFALNRNVFFIVFLLICALLCHISHAGVLYVKPNGTGDGLSWEQAMGDPQQAIEKAAVDDSYSQVWVAKGEYLPLHRFNPVGEKFEDDPRSVHFSLRNGVSVYGGFAGTESDSAQRNIEINHTIFSGDIGIEGENSDNAYHIFFHPEGTSLDESAVLDGITITGGRADGMEIHNAGGGMYNFGSSPFLINVTMTYNFGISGGGMYNYQGNPALESVILTDNAATNGAGIYNDVSSPVLTNVTISNNSGAWGGGLYNFASQPSISNSRFFNNHARRKGGGIFNYASSPLLMNTTVNDNTASEKGGGMYNESSNPSLTNVTIGNNHAQEEGGGLFSLHGRPIITNCTVSENSSGQAGGIFNSSSSPVIRNSILWGNSADEDNQYFNEGESSPEISWSVIQGGYPDGQNIISEDPLLGQLDYNGGFTMTYSIPESSPAVVIPAMAGENTWNQSPAMDQRCLRRSRNLRAAGSYEPTAVPLSPEIIHVDIQAEINGDGSTWESAFNLFHTAVSAALAGDQIWMAAGLYRPWTRPNGAPDDQDPRSVHFSLKNGVSIYGGFAGNESELSQRSFETNHTIFSGDIGEEGTVEDNAYHVFYHPQGLNLNQTAVLDGAIITGGNPDNHHTPQGGGMHNQGNDPVLINVIIQDNSGTGIFNLNSSPTLTNVVIRNNSGGGIRNFASNPLLNNVSIINNSVINFHGGGMYNDGSSPVLNSVIITGNEVLSDNENHYSGGGISNWSGSHPVLNDVNISNNSAQECSGLHNSNESSPILNDVVISHNQALRHGGGMCNFQNSNPTLSHVLIQSNVAQEFDAGGMFNSQSHPVLNDVIIRNNEARQAGGMGNESSNPRLNNVTMTDNTARAWGGAMRNHLSNPILNNVTIAGNNAYSFGGGMYNEYNSSPVLTNVTISGNRVNTTATEAGLGGGIYNKASSPVLINVTVTENTSREGGGFYNNEDSNTVIVNSILWNNSLPQIVNSNSEPEVDWSLIQGGYPDGRNIIVQDPQLGPLTDNGGLSMTHAISGHSPAYAIPENAGNGQWNNSPDTDQRGAPRTNIMLRAMGAYEDPRGGVLVSIIPEAAVSEGAGWKIEHTTSWMTSGETAYTTAGEHAVQFRPIPGWEHPADLMVMVNAEEIFTAPPAEYSQKTSHNVRVFAFPEEGGQVAGGGEYTDGSLARISAEAGPDYTFLNWTEGDLVVSIDSFYEFTVRRNHDLHANFIPVQDSYEIFVLADPAEGGEVTGGGNYAHGSEASVIAVAGSGWSFVGWTESGLSVSHEAEHRFIVDKNRTLTAHFTRKASLPGVLMLLLEEE